MQQDKSSIASKFQTLCGTMRAGGGALAVRVAALTAKLRNIGIAEDVIKAVVDTLKLIDAPVGLTRGIADSSRRYHIPNRIVAEEVTKQINRLESLLDQHNIKILRQLDDAPTNASGARRFGNFDPETRTITLFKGSTDVNYLEELHHMERAIKGGHLGQAVDPTVIADWERRFKNLLRNLGVELLD